MQIVIMIAYADNLELYKRWRSEALGLVGEESLLEDRRYLSYLDMSLKGLVDVEGSRGVVPCRSIWDVAGSRLSTVLLLEC